MSDKKIAEKIALWRHHGLFLSRRCPDAGIAELSRELLGMHCWFHRNVVFSALIRGAGVAGWKHSLTKTWLYRGTLHGVADGELPKLLSLHRGESWLRRYCGEELIASVADDVIRYMEDGIYSRAEMRKLFAEFYEPKVVELMFSPWGGIFVHLASLGQVAFRSMTSRDFDMIDAAPVFTPEEVLPELLHRYFKVYGPATLDDAAWFFGFLRDDKKVLHKKVLRGVLFDEYGQFSLGKKIYYHCGEPDGMRGIPEFGLLSGFDPAIVSYVERGAVLPPEWRGRVILKSGICLPSIAVNGRVAGVWNIKKGEPVTEFFERQPARIERGVRELVDTMRLKAAGQM